MIAGLPGTGIGGLFYEITALGTPFRAWRARREGRADGSELGAWALVLMAAGLMGAVWLTGWAVGVLLGHPLTRALAVIGVARTVAPPPSLIRTVSLLLAVATLVTVLAAVEVARLVVHGRGTGRSAAPVITPPSAPAPRQDAAGGPGAGGTRACSARLGWGSPRAAC